MFSIQEWELTIQLYLRCASTPISERRATGGQVSVLVIDTTQEFPNHGQAFRYAFSGRVADNPLRAIIKTPQLFEC
ncbi:MAG: hypothetical protein DMG39_20780 [Acidobacteria bacterium]|nr:MAG: hypothetical protein DMG39_20780 [Acidobacteriota bacterium]